MTNLEINKRVYELMGLCWHEVGAGVILKGGQWCGKCISCGKYIPKEQFNYDFTTSWEAFGILWKWLQEHEKWGNILDVQDINGEWYVSDKLISSPRALAEAVVEFFVEEKNG